MYSVAKFAWPCPPPQPTLPVHNPCPKHGHPQAPWPFTLMPVHALPAVWIFPPVPLYTLHLHGNLQLILQNPNQILPPSRSLL